MNISGITNLNQYLIDSSRQLNVKFQSKKIDTSEQKTTGNNFLSEFIKQNMESQNTRKIQHITSKLKWGQKLSPSEMEYLKNNDPILYEKAVKIKKEREDYRRNLSNCKTKKEVLMTNFRKIAQFKIEEKTDDPYTIMMRIAAVLNEHADFVKSKEYKDLPKDEKEMEEGDESYEINESYNGDENSKKPEESKKSEEQNNAENTELKNDSKFKSKKIKKISMPEVNVAPPPNIFISLRA